jgi:RNA polymerase sigma factor (sigma-70 family)
MESLDGESSIELIERVRQGDENALETLLRRHLPRLSRWARGRLPRYVRDGADTDDLVQETVVSTLRRIETLEYPREGALQAYLRQALMNRIRDVIRRSTRVPPPVPLDAATLSDDRSPLDEVIGLEAVERYEAALQQLTPIDREAIIGRIELGYDYDELARALDKPSAGAARVAVGRALSRLAAKMQEAMRTSNHAG